jgi:membrane-associated phospholipid phosphatase
MAQNGGNAGNAAAGANWGGLLIADRTDLPFITVNPPDVGDARVASSAAPFTPYVFQNSKVDAPAAAWQALAEFTLVTTTAWQTLNPVTFSGSTGLVVSDDNPHNTVTVTHLSNGGYSFAPTAGGSSADWELDSLRTAFIDERPDSLGEIVAQADEFFTYFMDLLSFNPVSHPATTKVMHAANLIGLFAVHYWKNIYRRVRPAQLYPGLLPPVATPGYASFPSGHATQAQLIYHCLSSVLPGYGTANSLEAVSEIVLAALATRIARNREIAGLHYPTDSVAGRALADGIFTIFLLNPPAAMPTYNSYYQLAKAEWTTAP